MVLNPEPFSLSAVLVIVVVGAAKPHVVSGGVRRVLPAGHAAVAVAVALVAEEGAALLHLLGGGGWGWDGERGKEETDVLFQNVT